jgi:signal peptidase I
MTGDYVAVNGVAQTMPNASFTELMAAVLAKGALFRFQASGFSMSPFIRDGDVITVAPVPVRMRLGEVAAFALPNCNKLAVHRVVHISRAGYLLRGDNLPEPDGCVLHTAILGRVIRVEHSGRRMPFGLGVERIVIAFLSRRGWLAPLLVPIRKIFGPILVRR